MITITGGSGVVGRHLLAELPTSTKVRVLSRHQHHMVQDHVDCRQWDPARVCEGNSAAIQQLADALSGTEIIINLAGASIGDGRLDQEHRQRVLQSRLDSTNALTVAFSHLGSRPRIWLQASAIGYYGDTAEQRVDEQSQPATNSFLSDVCQQWEAAASHAASLLGVSRLCIARIGLVIAHDAPAWQKMLLPIKLGMGGNLGSGDQWFAWVDADDVARAFRFLIEHENAQGVYNFTAPYPERQGDIAKHCARALRRPAIFPAPAPLLRLALGKKVADSLLLTSCKAVPAALQEANFEFGVDQFEQGLTKWLR